MVRAELLRRTIALSVVLGAAPAIAVGQETAASPPAAAASMPAHDMASMHDMATHDMPTRSAAMRSALGPYPMTRGGSGTSWQPEATPMDGLHVVEGEWSLMAHGLLNAIVDRQSGPRGDDKAFAQSMAMLMGTRSLGAGTLGLRAMLSLDPSMGKSGYPLLFQTGETADGKTPLVDRQHPHDFFMELSTSYSLPFADDGAVFAYVGLPGEPALGPPAFMHRFSAMRNPEAPLTHHWLDSTHISFGVATLGLSKGPLQLEASWFNGREPDPYRWNIETRQFDSWSTRLTYNPSPELSMQVSYGELGAPEQLEPMTRVRRSTASLSYFRNSEQVQWGTTLAYGRNQKVGPTTRRSEPGWLLESTLTLRDRHTVFARAEQVDSSELLDAASPSRGEGFQIRKFSFGYLYDFAKTGAVGWSVGGVLGLPVVPAALDSAYGRHPRSTMLLLQGRL